MLQLRPSCENCDKALSPNATDAMICSFECTFCASCVQGPLMGVCPNCGGGFSPRPIRPKGKLKRFPPSEKRVYKPVDLANHAAFAANIKDIRPEDR